MVTRKKKDGTFDGPAFWKNAYAHQKASVLRMIGTPEDKIIRMSGVAYLDLPLDTRYEIETSPKVDKSKLS